MSERTYTREDVTEAYNSGVVRARLESKLSAIVGTVAIVVIAAAVVASFIGVNPFQRPAQAPEAQATAFVPSATQAGGSARNTGAQAGQLSLDQVNATSVAVYEATAQASLTAPVPNVNPAPAPAQLGSRPATERQAAPDVVPTAEPVTQAESGGIFGSKPAIVAPQETHECRHGQVWTARGCKNPTPVK
jgi:hypothetical protein